MSHWVGRRGVGKSCNQPHSFSSVNKTVIFRFPSVKDRNLCFLRNEYEFNFKLRIYGSLSFEGSIVLYCIVIGLIYKRRVLKKSEVSIIRNEYACLFIILRNKNSSLTLLENESIKILILLLYIRVLTRLFILFSRF